MVSCDAVFECVRSAGIFRDVAANGTCDLRRGIRSIEEAVRLNRVAHVKIDDAALDLHAPVGDVNREDAVHPGGAYHHGRADRQASAGKTGAGAARDKSDAVLVQQLQDGADFRSRAGAQEDFRDALFDRPPVAFIDLEFGRAGDETVAVENRA